MNLEKKINEIGRILSDISLEVHTIRRNQEELREFICNPDKLDTEIFWNKLTKK